VYNNFTIYQRDGLLKLITYKDHFKKSDSKNALPTSLSDKINRALISQEFIEVFCSYDLANTDYAAIQIEPLNYASFEEWVETINIETILKSITYIIWTDRIVDGYFNAKIEDHSLFFLLARLEKLLTPLMNQLTFN
jgi:hypothetical protein